MPIKHDFQAAHESSRTFPVILRGPNGMHSTSKTLFAAALNWLRKFHIARTARVPVHVRHVWTGDHVLIPLADRRRSASVPAFSRSESIPVHVSCPGTLETSSRSLIHRSAPSICADRARFSMPITSLGAEQALQIACSPNRAGGAHAYK